MGRLRKLIMTGTIAAVGCPATAMASTVELRPAGTRSEGHGAVVRLFDLHVQGQPGEANDIAATPLGGYPEVFRLSDAGAPLSPGEGCRPDGSSVVCSAPDQQSRVQTASIDLGDGDDRFHLAAAPTAGSYSPRPR